MTRAALPAAGGAAVGAFLYALLLLCARDVPPPEDPWLDAFESEGLRAEFRSEGSEAARHLLLQEARDAFREPPLSATTIRHYQVQAGPVQVLVLPDAAAYPGFPEGRHAGFKHGESAKGPGIHLCRSGRYVLLAAPQGRWVPFVGLMKRPDDEVARLFDAFEEARRRLP
jgi:hypothetical protein